MSNREPPIGITGLWLRREGNDAVVLVEVDGEWRKVIVEYWDGAYSHISEQAAIRKAPVDEVTSVA